MKRFTYIFLATVLVVNSLIFQPVVGATDGALSDPVETSLKSPIDGTEPLTEIQEAVEQTPQTAFAEVVDEKKELTPQPVAIASPQTPEPVTVTPQLQYLPVYENDLLLSSFKFTRSKGYEFVEIYNSSDDFIDLSNIRIILLASSADDDYQCEIQLDGFLKPKSYLGYAESLSGVEANNADVQKFTICPGMSNADLDKSIQVVRGGSVIEQVHVESGDMPVNVASKAWRRSTFGTTTRTGKLSVDFKVATDNKLNSSQLYFPIENLPFKVVEVLASIDRDCSSSDFDQLMAGCRKYIKVINPGNEPIDLSEFVLRTGTPGTSSTSANSSRLSGILGVGDFATIYQAIDNEPLIISSEGSVWFEDIYGLKVYPTDIAYSGSDNAANIGKTWAYFGDSEKWSWGDPSPLTVENTLYVEPTIPVEPGKGSIELVPCRDDQYRSQETNRCRNIVVASVPKACKEGQYRSEETGRCRSIVATVASVLKPCADDQFRNPTTGRCKKIASAEDILQPCDSGYERNPETNRCRKVAIAASSVPDVPYAVASVQDGPKAFAAWWAVGGVVVLALAYAGWEWREELKRVANRIRSQLSSRNK